MKRKEIILYVVLILIVILLIILLQRFRECENKREITKSTVPCKFWSFNN